MSQRVHFRRKASGCFLPLPGLIFLNYEDSSSAWQNKKEGGKSQFDVGGNDSHRLLPIGYTSIADIKGFCFKSQ